MLIPLTESECTAADLLVTPKVSHSNHTQQASAPRNKVGEHFTKPCDNYVLPPPNPKFRFVKEKRNRNKQMDQALQISI